jgi:glycosyltransferase involved in cell wall biosynthesis
MTGDAPLVVLQLVANRWWTGSADPVIQLSRGLEARGHRVLLGLIPGSRFEDKAREAGLAPLGGLSLEARVDPVRLLRDLMRLSRLVRTERVDVVHTHHSHDHWLGLFCRGRAALVRSFHSARAVNLRWPARALYRRSDALIAVSDEVAARCRAAGVAAERIVRVDGVTDVARFRESGGGEAIRKEFGLGPGPVAGCVARLAPRRGHETLIRAFALLLARHPDARLLLVGKGERRSHLEAFIRDHGLAQQVLFAGYRDHDLPAVLDALDMFVLLGAGSDESCRAALEAMAAGRPVVARRVGALGEAVVDGTTGLVVDDDRPESVAAALQALIEDPDRARMMGEAGKHRALSVFTPQRHAARVEAVYRHALARIAPGASAASG